MIRIGIVGLGYWGPNFERNFMGLSGSTVTAVCDLSKDRLTYSKERFPSIYTTNSLDEILAKGLVDAFVVATPTKTHYEIAKKILNAGLHIFIEKPLATSSAECRELIELAESRNLVLFVGHLFLYNAAVSEIIRLKEVGELGHISHLNSQRLNLGPIRKDVSALWDLAPHDISIMLKVIGALPISVNCQGLAYLNDEIEDVCTLTMNFEKKCMATINVSWLSPHKTRLMTLVGDKKMIIYDDMEPLEKIKIYNKRVEAPSYSDTFGEFQFAFHYGDTNSPWLNQVEPLKAECQHFLDCIENGKKPITDGLNGLEVVSVLEAAQKSMENKGNIVELEGL